MKINTEIIKALNPCAHRFENFLYHYPVFNGDHDDFLDLTEISHADKLWVLLRLMSRFEAEVFTVDCAVNAATYAAHADTYAAHADTYAAYYAANPAASYVAHAATYAAYAANYVANSAGYSVGYAAERERQLDAISYLINSREETR